MGAVQYGGWMASQPAGYPAAQPAGYGLDRRSDQRRSQARPSPELRGHGTHSEHTDVRALALALTPHFALPVPGA